MKSPYDKHSATASALFHQEPGHQLLRKPNSGKEQRDLYLTVAE